MKAKKTVPPRRRVSFAVDRDEIEINSGWVDAVMTSSPAVPSIGAPDPSSAPIPFPVPPAPQPSRGNGEADHSGFFVSDKNTATGAHTATDAECTAVEMSSAVDKVAPVAESAAVEYESPVENGTTVAKLRPIAAPGATGAADNDTAVEHNTPVELFSTVALSTSTKDHRVSRPRRIIRITDGLTPGQYAVYSLMYQAGETAGGSSRIYKGGYADLGRLTGLSKRGIQNIVAELQAKEVIRLHRQPGYHRTETSAYLIPEPEAVLSGWFSKGWRHALGKSKTLIS